MRQKYSLVFYTYSGTPLYWTDLPIGTGPHFRGGLYTVWDSIKCPDDIIGDLIHCIFWSVLIKERCPLCVHMHVYSHPSPCMIISWYSCDVIKDLIVNTIEPGQEDLLYPPKWIMSIHIWYNLNYLVNIIIIFLVVVLGHFFVFLIERLPFDISSFHTVSIATN